MKETISEETLEKVSAGINIDKDRLKKILIKSGVVISACVPVIGLTAIGLHKLKNRSEENSNSKKQSTLLCEPEERIVVLNTKENSQFLEVSPNVIFDDVSSEEE